MSDARPILFVIEDCPVNRKFVTVLLRTEGYDVRGFPSAEAAMPSFAGDLPRAVILDLDLPGMSGLDLAQRLRGDTRTRRLPILAVSANDGPGSAARARAAGCDGFVAKPLDLKTFPAVVARCAGGESGLFESDGRRP